MTTTPAATGGLTPVETEYAGYRFRSRLEARWALYFDLCKIRWAYESEGFTLSDGQRYLPDFWLPDYNQFVEVKPDTEEQYITQRPRVYMAGKMGPPQDNKTPGQCWRKMDVNMDNHGFRFAAYPEYNENYDFSPSVDMSLRGTRINYIGPWKGRESEHGYLHGIVTWDYSDHNSTIYRKSIGGVVDCDEFFALLTDPTSYGTLVELGHASALRKNIVVGIRPIEENSHPADHNWFACQAASHVISRATDEDIVRQYAEYLRSKYPETKYDIMMRDATAAHVGFRMVMGDPRTMKTERGTGTRELPFNQMAADTARQHRFGR
jgi:nucleoside 2-deoxyribosyltransferase